MTPHGTDDTEAEDTREVEGPTEADQEQGAGEAARAREAIKHDDVAGSDDHGG